EDRTWVRERLPHWWRNSDLASLRDRAALARLPTSEQIACRQLWAGAATLYGRLAELKMHSYSWFELACLRCLGDDPRNYEWLRTQLLQRVGQSKDHWVAFLAARTCAVLPQGSPNPAQAVRWAEQAVRSHPKWDGYLHTLGLAHLRAGQWKEA